MRDPGLRRLRPNDLDRDWSVEEFRTWLGGLLEDWKRTPEGKTYLRLREANGRFDPNMKRLVEEALPVVRLCERIPLLPPSTRFRLTMNDGPADAWLLNQASDPIPIQVTCALTKDDRLRMELLNEAGIAPGFGRIRRPSTGQIEAEHEAYTSPQALVKFQKDVEKPIRAKMAKPYSSETWLVISVVDEALPDREVPTLVQFCKKLLQGSRFAAAYLIGTDGRRALAEPLV